MNEQTNDLNMTIIDQLQNNAASSTVPNTEQSESTKENFSEDAKSQLNNEDYTAMNIAGLRRSTRVPKPRSDLNAGLEEEYKKRPYKKRVKPKPNSKTKGKVKVKKVTKQASKKGKTDVKKSASKNVSKQAKNGQANFKQAQDTQEPSITDNNWAPCTPLLNSDFKTQQSVSSRLKNPNMKAVAYAGDVLKIMSFINKFYSLFDQDLLNLSFQDFEIGLDIYPGDNKGSADGIFSTEKNRVVYYQDYILVKEVITAQDKMNLLFLTLLQLLFDDPDKFEAPTLANLTAKNVFKVLIEKLRKNVVEWGYPKEWRSTDILSDEVGKGKFPVFPSDESGLVVDPSHPEILTPNVYVYSRNDPLPLESDPLQTPGLADEGVLALSANNRIILLRALIDWCGVQSLLVHHEVYQLSHLKRETPFGIQTQHVARFYLEGPEITFNYFRKLCTIIQSRYEIRSKKKHYRKQLNEGKNPALSAKLKLLEEIREELKNVEKSQKRELIISLYDKWIQLFQGELTDNPLTDPFADPVYTLRSQEFFIGRVPYMGDFYLPRLHTYGDVIPMSTYTDLRKLKSVISKFKNKEFTVYNLFEEYGQTMSSQFKVLYHDTPSLLHDMAKNKKVKDKCYWYEMCHDTESLREFLDFLDFKIVKPPEKPKDKLDGEKEVKEETPLTPVTLESNIENNTINITPENISGTDITSDKKQEISNINTHPLPRDPRYNSSRKKLTILKEYLSDFYYILHTFELLRNEYSDMKPGRRQLRDLKRNLINYNMDYESDEMEE